MTRKKTYDSMGFTLTYPDVFDQPKGLFTEMPIGSKGNGMFFMLFNYIALSAEDVAALEANSVNGQPSQEESMKMMKKMGILLTLVGIDGGRGIKEVIKAMKTDKISEDNFTEVGRHGDITYYAISDHDSEETYVQRQDPGFGEEFRTLQAALIEALKNAEYFEPRIPGADLIGRTVRFETTDIDGNPVKSEDLFAGHAVTMVNFWATWCGPCKSELEELGNIHRRIAEHDAAIIGICLDADEKPEECRALIKEKSITYVNLMPDGKLDTELDVASIPTSVFVSREGKIMTHPFIGVPADISEYEKTFEKLLAQAEAGIEPAHASEASPEKKNGYRVVVKGSDGAPVQGASVQFCSDTTCMMGRTNEEGIAFFDTAEGHYTVHVMKVPDGYVKTDEEFAVPEVYGDVEITLNKA